MVSSISKNTKKQNKDIKRMVDALISGQISKLSSKDMDINIEVWNDTKLSSSNKKYEQYCITGARVVFYVLRYVVMRLMVSTL